MLSKVYRMKKNTQFDYIFKNGKSLKYGKLLIFYSVNKSKYNKFGIVVSKKIGNSVVRNRAKRLIREAIRANLDKISKNYNYIIVARLGIENQSYSEIKNSLEALLKNAKVYV